MRIRGILLLLIFTSSLVIHTIGSADNTISLQERLFHGHKDDYAVFAQGTKRFFTSIREVSADSLWLEITEFAFLNYQDKKLIEQQSSWKNLLPQLTSSRETFIAKISEQDSCLFALDPKTNTWKPSSLEEAPKLFKLLKISLYSAPESKLKMDNNNEPWRPKVSLEGKTTPYQTMSVYTSTWPQDGSLLSGNCILIYFTSPTLSAFPIWTAIETFKGPVIIRTIDVGHQVTSPNPPLPH